MYTLNHSAKTDMVKNKDIPWQTEYTKIVFY